MFLSKRECRFPSGLAERQTTHSSASGTDECKRTVHECARDSPSLVCRGHPGCVVWDAAGTHKRPRPRVVFFLPAGVRRARGRESPCPAPEVSRQRVTGGCGVTLSLRVGSRPREASRSAKQRDLTAPPSQKTKSDTCATRERTCASDVQRKYTAQFPHLRSVSDSTHFAVSTSHILSGVVRARNISSWTAHLRFDSLDILAMVRGSPCMTRSPSSFLCCTMVALTLMTRCLSEVLTKGKTERGEKVFPLLCTFQEMTSVFSNARAKVVQKELRLQGKLTPACEFPSVCFRKSFFSKSKRTSVPSGTKETPRGVTARAQGPTGPTSGIPAPGQVP